MKRARTTSSMEGIKLNVTPFFRKARSPCHAPAYLLSTILRLNWVLLRRYIFSSTYAGTFNMPTSYQ